MTMRKFGKVLHFFFPTDNGPKKSKESTEKA